MSIHGSARPIDPGLPVVFAAAKLAREQFERAFAQRWPTRLRALGALALLARADLDRVPPGSARRTGRLLLHRLTGR